MMLEWNEIRGKRVDETTMLGRIKIKGDVVKITPDMKVMALQVRHYGYLKEIITKISVPAGKTVTFDWSHIHIDLYQQKKSPRRGYQIVALIEKNGLPLKMKYDYYG